MKNKKRNINLIQILLKQKFLLLIYVLCYLGKLALDFIAAIKLGDALTNVSNGSYDLAINDMFLVLILYLSSVLVNNTSNIAYYQARYITRIDIKMMITTKIFGYSSQTYNNVQIGRFIERIKNDPNNWFNSIDNIIVSSMHIILNLAIIVYISFLNIYVGLVLLVGSILLIIADRIRNKIQLKMRAENLLKDENNTSLITEVVKGEKDIKGLRLDGNVSQKLVKSNEELEKSNRTISIITSFLFETIDFIGNITTFAMILVSIFLLKNSYLTIGIIMYIFANKGSFSGIARSVRFVGVGITEAKLSSKRMNELFDESIYKLEKFGDKKIENFKGEITFDNVYFEYEDYDKKFGVLNGISFNIKPNTTTAFVGRSGSGKTTIINLIPKLLDAQSGVVSLDGINIQELSKETIRSNIALVNQFPYIFDDTIKGNLLLAKPDATNDELWKVLEDSSLKEFIQSLPDGIDTKVGESGVKLSGGQRQRLSIARALLKNSRIIIFDESTSSLDNYAQFDIQKSIEKLSGNRTIIIVAHRLSTIKSADNILFVKDGVIADSGTFDNLFNNNINFQNMFLVEKI